MQTHIPSSPIGCLVLSLPMCAAGSGYGAFDALDPLFCAGFEAEVPEPATAAFALALSPLLRRRRPA